MKTPTKFRAKILNRFTSKTKTEVGHKLLLRFSEHHDIWHVYVLGKDGWYTKDTNEDESISPTPSTKEAN